MDPARNDPSQKKITRLYLALGAGLVLSLMPHIAAAVLSTALFMGVLFAAYAWRSDSEQGSLLENHMTFIIRTIWISCLLSLATMTAASLYLFRALDNTPLNPCINSFLSINPDPASMNMEAMYKIFEGCWRAYWPTNFKAFVISGIIAAGPVLLYFLTRYMRGFMRAQSGRSLANPKSWL